MSRRRWIFVSALMLSVLLAVAYGFVPRPVTVEAVGVARGPLRETVREEARTRVAERFAVSSPVAGHARRIRLDVGDRVRRGDPLVEIEPLRSPVLDPRALAEARDRVEAAEAALAAAAEAGREAAAADGLAQKRLTRTRDLFASGIATRDALDQAEAEARRARAAQRSAGHAVEVARSNADAARAALGHSAAAGERPREGIFALRAPVSGWVLAVPRKSEGVVAPGQTLVEIGDPGTLEVAVEVLSADAVRIRPGMTVDLERWGGECPLDGRVRLVEPAGFTKVSALGVEEQRVLVIADIVSEAPGCDRLGDGYRLEARFVLWEGTDVLQVPAGALFRKGDGWAAFVVDGRRARERIVRTGHRGEAAVEVLEGLAEGDRVIQHPGDAVRDGVWVRMR